MTIEEQTETLLTGDAGLTALVPTARIKVPGDWQDLPRPYIVHFPVSPEPTYLQESRAALTCWRNYQVSCFADLYSTARTVAAAVVSALSGQHSGVTFFWRDQRFFYESDIKVHQVVLDFEVYEAF